MKRIDNKYLKIICLILMFLQMNYTFANNIETVIHFGDSLYSEQKYIVALNEYQRAFFFSEKEKKVVLSLKIANCNIVLNEFDAAKAYCDSALYYADTDSAKTECRFHKILCYILEKNYGYALLKLDEIKTDSNRNFVLKRDFYQGISYYGLQKYDKAFQFLTNSFDKADTVKLSKLQQLFKNKNKLNRPNPTLATILSIVIPGSGQIYAGKYFNGINSIVLLTGITFLAFNSPALYVFVTPFLPRYYLGGILHANQFAKENRKQKQSYFIKDILELFHRNDNFNSHFVIKDIHKNYHQYVFESDSEIPIILSSSFLLYKKFFSSQDVNACVYNPSCSVYMMETIKRNGAVVGFLDGLDRLLRCHSFVNKEDYINNRISDKYYDPI